MEWDIYLFSYSFLTILFQRDYEVSIRYSMKIKLSKELTIIGLVMPLLYYPYIHRYIYIHAYIHKYVHMARIGYTLILATTLFPTISNAHSNFNNIMSWQKREHII